MNVDRKRAIREAEMTRAVEEVCDALDVEPGLLPEWRTNTLIGALAKYALQTRKPWETRERDLRFTEIMEGQGDRLSKLRRLIDHPDTSEAEREAARGALARIRAGGRENTP